MLALGFALCVLALLFVVFKRKVEYTALLILGSVSIAYSAFRMLLSGVSESLLLALPAPWGDIVLSFTPLSAFFAIFFALGSITCVFYGYHYLQKYAHKDLRAHLISLGILIISMQLCLLAQHALVFFFAWELMSFSSFYCILLEEEKAETTKSALYYLAMMQVGAFFLLAGFAFAYLQFASFSFQHYKALGTVPLLLLGIGFAFKAGFFPFYSWLPIAHPAAPSHISALMSGIMLKTGIFGLLLLCSMSEIRIEIAYILALIAFVTALSGIMHALVETDIKKILAYSSIENIGIIGLGISFALLAKAANMAVMAHLLFAGVLLHSLNHAVFKPLLFLLSGNIYQQTHSRELDELGGLQKKMPVTGILFLIGVIGITALPLFGGFVSELFLYLGFMQGFEHSNLLLNLFSILAAAALTLIGALALFAFVRMYGLAFLGEARSTHASDATEVKVLMNLAPLVLATLCMLLGLSAYPLLLLIDPLIAYLGIANVAKPFIYALMYKLSLVFVAFALMAVLFYILRRQRLKYTVASTWGCGYAKASPKMQYTANSLIHPLAYFLKPFLKKRDELDWDPMHFPQGFSFEVKVHDVIDDHIIKPSYRILDRLLRTFSGLQGGNTRLYITYGLVFLIILLIWAIGV